MSRTRGHRPKAKPLRGEALQPADFYAIQAAATRHDTKAEVDEAMQMSHDKVIADLGARRTTGVRWEVSRGADRQAALLGLQAASIPTDKLTEWFDQFPDGVLVLAFAGHAG